MIYTNHAVLLSHKIEIISLAWEQWELEIDLLNETNHIQKDS